MIKMMSVLELIRLAKSTTSIDLLEELKNSLHINVRRAVAKNRVSSEKILNFLAMDPVLNVSYIASINPNCTLKRDFTTYDHPCVTCVKDEESMDCTGCQKSDDYYRK